jgi:hypothetical protein
MNPPNEKPPSRFWKSWRKIAVTYGVIMAVIVGGLGVVFVLTHRDLVASRYRGYAEQMVKALDLSLPDQQRVMTRVDRVLDLYREETLTDEQSEKLVEEFNASALPKIVAILAIDVRMLPSSTLDKDLQEQARRNVRRLIRGVVERKIGVTELEPVFRDMTRRRDDTAPPPEQSENETTTLAFDRSLPDEDLEALLKTVAGVLESHEISGDDSAGDIAGEVDRVAAVVFGPDF